MHADSTVNWLAPPARLPVSYLPPPYGSRRIGVDASVWRSEGGVSRLHESSARRGAEWRTAMRGVTSAADFGHDNLAWSGTRTRSGRGRIMAAAFGGGLIGAAVVALLGVADIERFPLVASSEPAPVAEHALARAAGHERIDTAPATVSHILHMGQGETGPVIGQAARIDEGKPDESGALISKASQARLDQPPARLRKPVGNVDTRDVVRKASVMSSAHATRHKRPDVGVATSTLQQDCADDWPCGEVLTSMRIDLAVWEARQRRRESAAHQPANTLVRLEQHVRLTDE